MARWPGNLRLRDPPAAPARAILGALNWRNTIRVLRQAELSADTPGDAGFLQLAQRLSATVCIAAATGIALTDGPAQPSARGLGLALGLCAALIALSLLVSLRRG